MNVLSPLDETVRDLTLAQHLPRIKKLLVYACTHHWESNATGLSSYHLHDLVQQLLHIAPTFSALKAHLNGVIQTLNKPAEYTLVANTIVRHLQPLYPDAISYASEHYQALYRIAAQQLEQHDDVERMKKLIHFVCRDQWTHDLDAVKLYELIAELHILTPTSNELTAVLESVVQTISKPDKYRAIAQQIIDGLAPLYHPTTHALMQADPTALTSPQTTLQSTVQTGPSRQPAMPVGLPSEEPALAEGSTPAQPSQASSSSGTDAQEKRPKPISMRKKVASLPPDDLFELRNEIHKFTNPLLAKYLLFMNRYAAAVKPERENKPGQWDSMVWDALKATDLDTLLCDGLKQCRNLGEFERSLKRTARQFQNSKQYSAVISAIVRAVTPKFADCQDVPIVYPPLREDSQGTPTYGKRRSRDGDPSQPLDEDQAINPGLESDNHRLSSQKASPNSPEHLNPLSEQETAFEMPLASASNSAPSANIKTSELSTVGLETSGMDPTESEACLEDTETELPSQVDQTDQNQEVLEQDQKGLEQDQELLEQDMHLEQQMVQKIDEGPDDTTGEETAYLVAPTSAPTRPEPPDDTDSSPGPSIPNRTGPQAMQQVVDETLFLPTP